MKQVKRSTVVTRARGMDLCTSTAVMFLILAILLAASGSHAQVTVAVGDGSGAPDGTASVTSTLTGGEDKAALVQYDVVFDTNVLAIQTSDCVLAPRLDATHTLQVFLPQPDRLRVEVLDLTFPIATFSDGDLATCTFQINANASLGTTPLTMENLEVADNSVPPAVLPSTKGDGVVTIALVTPTPTVTNTPVEATNTPTATNTPVQPTNTPTATNTPVNTPTATNTPVQATATTTRTSTPVATNTSAAGFGEGGGCSIAASGGADASPLAWLIVPAALLLRRRRAQR
jgi:MYXO-CTERM domain-containing protein